MNIFLQLSILLTLGFSRCYAQCPRTDGYLRRVGETRFYVLHRNERGSFSNWADAFKLCEKYGLKLARVPRLTTFNHILHPLRKIAHDNQLMDTWYWTSAKFDSQIQKYRWHTGPNSPDNPLNFTVIFYRQPRPIGVGGHADYRGVYDTKYTAEQCLSYALPYPELRENNGIVGRAGSFDERACVSSNTRHVMCEASSQVCKLKEPGPYRLSEGKEAYFEEGNWIFGERRYIVNWGQREHKDAKFYCQKLGMKLYNPITEDACLIPLLKMWTRNVTLSQFWTSWTFDSTDGSFKDIKGNVRAMHVAENRDWGPEEGAVRSSKQDTKFCVAMSHWYEFRNQLPCNTHDPSLCRWHFASYVPANCYNNHATICQHEDYEERECIWKNKWIENVTRALIETATLPFGHEGNGEYVRSTYKQTFGSLVCPDGYNMVRDRNIKWHKPPAGIKLFEYDYSETYWVVDSDKFNKPKGSLCSVSKFENGHRRLGRVPCTKWNFYLCKKRKLQPSVPRPKPPQGFSVPQWYWNDQPTPRKGTF